MFKRTTRFITYIRLRLVLRMHSAYVKPIYLARVLGLPYYFRHKGQNVYSKRNNTLYPFDSNLSTWIKVYNTNLYVWIGDNFVLFGTLIYDSDVLKLRGLSRWNLFLARSLSYSNSEYLVFSSFLLRIFTDHNTPSLL